MPGMTPLRPDDVHSARAWAAFVADDAAAAAPPSLEARVLRAAQAALAQKQRADAERRTPSMVRRHQRDRGEPPRGRRVVARARRADRVARHGRRRTASRAATTPESSAASRRRSRARKPIDEPPGRPVPMTNIEAGRVLGTPPPARLASRPLFDPLDGVGPVRAPGALRAKSFGAAVVEPVAVARTHAAPIAPPPPAHEAAAPPVVPGALAGAAPEAWSLRGQAGLRSRRGRDRAAATGVSPGPRHAGRRRRAEDPPAPPK